MPPKGWRKHPPESDASPNDTPNDSPAPRPEIVEVPCDPRLQALSDDDMNLTASTAPCIETVEVPVEIYLIHGPKAPLIGPYTGGYAEMALDQHPEWKADGYKILTYTLKSERAARPTAGLESANAALLKATRKVARWTPDVAKPEHRGPFTADIMALKAALAEHDAARNQP